MRVAIVDDEVQERETMRSYLERFATETGNAIETDLYPSGDALLAEYKLGIGHSDCKTMTENHSIAERMREDQKIAEGK